MPINRAKVTYFYETMKLSSKKRQYFRCFYTKLINLQKKQTKSWQKQKNLSTFAGISPKVAEHP